ncbi:MAG: hypothetical protein SNG97_06760 [Rikenellaceae bacterium]
MNWRVELRNIFEDATAAALSRVGLQAFEGFNSQANHNGRENYASDLSVLFSYASIGGGQTVKLREKGIQSRQFVPVVVSLQVVFRDFTDDAQMAAYDYADALCAQLDGVKNNPILHGRIFKTSESEDTNHDALYVYTLTFAVDVWQVHQGKEIKDMAEVVDIKVTNK